MLSRPDGELFAPEAVFVADYLRMYGGMLSDEISDLQASMVWRLLGLTQGMHVLDVACGHGRLANRLASRGAGVTGLDLTPLFLDIARRDAQALGVQVDYVLGDMRDLPWEGEFDAAICMFSSFGYFEDEQNGSTLREVKRALKPGGQLCLDTQHLPWQLANFREEIVTQRGQDWMIDRNWFDPLTSRTVTSRTVIRAGRQRSFEYAVRLFAFPEREIGCSAPRAPIAIARQR